MKHTALYLLVLSLLACGQADPKNQTETRETGGIMGLKPSINALDNRRFRSTDTAKPVCPFESSFCYEYAQEQIRAKYPDIVQPIGDGLSIKLFNGKIKKYMPSRDDDPDFCSTCGYLVINEYPALDSILIYKQYYEGHAYIFLNLKTGQEIDLSGMPTFSHDYKYMLSNNSDVEVRFTDNELKIYKFDQDNNPILMLDAIEQLPQFDQDHNIGFAKATWLDRSSFVVKTDDLQHQPRYPSDEFHHHYYKFSLVVDGVGTRWGIEQLSEDDYNKLKQES